MLEGFFYKRLRFAIAAAAFLGLAMVALANAWVVDDAYITFRTVDNFVQGYGLRWNLNERVQVYTHPFWMFCISLLYLGTREFFFTSIFFSWLLFLASVGLSLKTTAAQTEERWWKLTFFSLLLLASKAPLDYASSGLENPLSYLLLSLFLWFFLNPFSSFQKQLFFLFFLASLSFFNRMDTILLYLPALLGFLASHRYDLRPAHLGLFLLATSPAWGWLLFSVIYYGFPFPNTAYAKAVSIGFPFSFKLQRGLAYQFNSLSWDTAAYIGLALGAWFSWRKKDPWEVSLFLGIIAYLVFTLVSGASATHMSGRFYALPLFLGLVLFVRSIGDIRPAAWASFALLGYMAWNPIAAVKFGTSAYQPPPQNKSYIDTKWYVLNEGAALLNWRPGKRMPDHPWYRWGEGLRRHPKRVFLGGAGGGEAIGYVGLAAGPQKHFIDRVALSDPFLARLPARLPTDLQRWKSGHFHRDLPEGYIESIVSGGNHIRDPKLRRFYEAIRSITRDPLFDGQRWRYILDLHLGRIGLPAALPPKSPTPRGDTTP